MVLLFFGQLESSGKTLTFRISAYSRDRLIGEEIRIYIYIYITQKISFYHSTSLHSVYLILHLTFKAITCASTSEI